MEKDVSIDICNPLNVLTRIENAKHILMEIYIVSRLRIWQGFQENMEKREEEGRGGRGGGDRIWLISTIKYSSSDPQTFSNKN